MAKRYIKELEENTDLNLSGYFIYDNGTTTYKTKLTTVRDKFNSTSELSGDGGKIFNIPISGVTNLYQTLSGMTTGSTKDLYNQLTGETFNRITGDTYLHKLITGITSGGTSGTIYEYYNEILPSNYVISINCKENPYVQTTLIGNDPSFQIELTNYSDGDKGKILINQTGFKTVALPEGTKGTINLPQLSGTIGLVNYNVIGSTVYAYSTIIVPDSIYPIPQIITPFLLVYSDSQSAQFIWEAPYGNTPGDSVSYYDIRYSNTLIDPDNATSWLNCRKVTNHIPVPGSPGTEQTLTVTGLAANKDYFFYIKAVKINYGVKYISLGSTPVSFRTLSSSDISKPYRISLTEDNLYTVQESYAPDDGLRPEAGPIKMIDEQENNVFLESGYPNETDSSYLTYHSICNYSRLSKPYYLMIDLFQIYSLEKLYIVAGTKFDSTIYGAKDITSEWEAVGTTSIVNSGWATIEFEKKEYRYLLLVQDKCLFTAFYEDDTSGSHIGKIMNVILYGRSVSNMPDGIKPPLRRSTTLRTVDDFCCTVGWEYEAPILHSLISGPFVRLYNNFTRFFEESNFYKNQYREDCKLYDHLEDWKFNTSAQSWLYDNTDLNLWTGYTGTSIQPFPANKVTGDILLSEYNRLGLKPFITQVSWPAPFSYYRYNGNYERTGLKDGTTQNCSGGKMIDQYWSGTTRPVWEAGYYGQNAFFTYSRNPNNYKLISKLQYNIAAKFGNNNSISQTQLSLVHSSTMFDGSTGVTESRVIGQNLISGIECGNEMQGTYPRCWNYDPFEAAALSSAVADGNQGVFIDALGGTGFGIKSADPNLINISPGLDRVDPGYIYLYFKEMCTMRSGTTIPVDVISVHQYWPEHGKDGARADGWDQKSHSLSPEKFIMTENNLYRMVEMRDRFFPTKEIWMTEYGCGEAGPRSSITKGQFQVNTLPTLNSNPARHRSEVKGSYAVRANILYMSMGLNLSNYYAIQTEQSFFGLGEYEGGAGYEMWDWYKLLTGGSVNPYSDVAQYECTKARNNFDATGLFGNAQANGYYPITNAFWWMSTFRKTFENYYFIGWKYGLDEKIKIACFKHKTENKGGYAVYYNDEINSGVSNFLLNFPTSIIGENVKKITTYIPRLPDPRDVVDPWHPQTKDYPIIGPVGQVYGESYARADRRINITGGTYSYPQGVWDQANALADYILNSSEGRHGASGTTELITLNSSSISINISEFPEYYLFDALPETEFKSVVENVSSLAESSTSVILYWNDTNMEDESYQVWFSTGSTTGYTLKTTVNKGVTNKATITGLLPGTGYYFKIIPVRGSLIGCSIEQAEFTGCATDASMSPVEGLTFIRRSVYTITLSWDYPVHDPNFEYFAIYKAGISGVFEYVGSATDVNNNTFVVGGLSEGQNYDFKVRVFGKYGKSDLFSNILNVSTLTQEQASPVLINAITDRVGTGITLTFDLNLSAIPVGITPSFVLKDNGVTKTILSTIGDLSNTNQLTLKIATGTVSDYSLGHSITISYNAPSTNYIKSTYDVKMESFSNLSVINRVGNFTNMQHTYYVGLTGPNITIPSGTTYWNQLAGHPYVANVSKTGLIDSYGEINENMTVSSYKEGTGFTWNPADILSGFTGTSCTITNLPFDNRYPSTGINVAAQNGWCLDWFSISSNDAVSRIVFSGLDKSHVYTVKVFASSEKDIPSPKLIKTIVGTRSSETINTRDNISTYMMVDECIPIPNGETGIINVDVKKMDPGPEGSINYFSFLILEEYS